MFLALIAALQGAAAPPPAAQREWVWAEIELTEGRGGVDRIEILPRLSSDGDRKLANVLVRRSFVFAGQTTSTEWADTARCPGLRASLDAITEARILAQSGLAAYEGPVPGPPPPHRTVATVKLGLLTLNAPGDSPLGQWIVGVMQTVAPCWRDTPP